MQNLIVFFSSLGTNIISTLSTEKLDTEPFPIILILPEI